MRNIVPVRLKNLSFNGTKIYIQSMLNCPSDDISGNISQAIRLEKSGCDILRVAIPDKQSLILIERLKEKINIPLVADIHFDYRLALEAVERGIDKIRINPGNIGNEDRVKAVADACTKAGVPIRIGVNSGSLEKELFCKYGGVTAEALVESALNHVSLLEKYEFNQTVISIKSSNVPLTVKAYRLLAQKCNYPLHLGVTEAGTLKMGIVKSAVGIGSLLLDGIGETIRVSLTADPEEEIYAAKDILQSIGKLDNAVELISCPTCGRTRIDIITLANQVEKAVAGIHKPLKVAVMGCAVNGPGEARDADIGIAGGDGCALLFKQGEIIGKYEQDEIISVLVDEIKSM